MAESSQTRGNERRTDAMHSLARAVAFANLDLECPEAQWETQRHIVGTKATPLRVLCHFRFPDEFGRALRMPPGGREAKVTSGPRQLVPIDLLDTEDPLEAQRHMRTLLTDIITGNSRGVIAALQSVTVSVRMGVAMARDDTKRSRPSRRHPSLDVWYESPLGYDELRYGVVLGGVATLYHRLGRCRSCNRFILAKTDRPVRYCANRECQPRGAPKPRGKAPSVTAGYKRQQRARQQRWDEHRDRMRAALNGTPSVRGLTKLVRQGERLLEECFRWKESPARKDAARVLDQARDRIRTLGAST
jgi:hypothetical protein